MQGSPYHRKESSIAMQMPPRINMKYSTETYRAVEIQCLRGGQTFMWIKGEIQYCTSKRCTEDLAGDGDRGFNLSYIFLNLKR